MNSKSELEEGSSPSGEEGFEFGGRWVFIALLLCALFYAFNFRTNAIARAQGPFIADGVEYLTMARHLTDDISLTVKPVRSGVFPLLLAVPLWLEKVWSGPSSPGGAEDPSSAMWVMYLFNALAILGAYQLGKLLRGPIAGLFAAFFTSAMPLFTQWTFNYLADVPSAAFGVWALVFWVQRKHFCVGLMLGLAVTMRYQCLIPLGAFFVVPVILRDWRALFRMSLGLAPAALVLGVADYIFWGEAFHSIMLFVPRQLTTFLPAGVVSKLFPVEALPGIAEASMNLELEAIAAKSRWWYFEESSRLLTRGLVYLFLLYPLARRSMRSKSGADMTLWIVATTVLVLSLQRYKESRYLIAVVPLIAALGASSALWGVTLVVRVLGKTKWYAVGVGTALLLGAGHVFVQASAWHQRDIQYRPFGAVMDAVNSIPSASRPCNVGLDRPWILWEQYPIRTTSGWLWFSDDFAILDFGIVAHIFAIPPEEWSSFGKRHLLRDLDYVVVSDPGSSAEGRRRWFNEYNEFAGYFYDPRENQFDCLLLRSNGGSKLNRPFWDIDDKRAREEPELASFGTNVQLIALDAEQLSTGRNSVKIDLRWRLPAEEMQALTAHVKVFSPEKTLIAQFDSALIPRDAYEQQARRGAALRTTHYVGLRTVRDLEKLGFEIAVTASENPEQGSHVLPLKVPGVEEPRTGSAAGFRSWIPLDPVREDKQLTTTAEDKPKPTGW